MGDLLATTTGNQLSTLEAKITAATDLLKPASDDAIASALIKLAGAGLPFPTGIEPSNAARVYQFALRGVSLEALKRTVMRIVQGDVERAREFIPTPPALAALVKAEGRELWMDRERLLLTADSLRAGEQREPASEESKSRVRAMVRQVQDNAAAIREEAKDEFYNKPEDELNRIFRNKVDPPPTPPGAGKFDDQRWFAQQEEIGNGKENFGSVGDAEALPAGDADGCGNGDSGDDSPFGFEDGGD